MPTKFDDGSLPLSFILGGHLGIQIRPSRKSPPDGNVWRSGLGSHFGQRVPDRLDQG